MCVCRIRERYNSTLDFTQKFGVPWTKAEDAYALVRLRPGQKRALRRILMERIETFGLGAWAKVAQGLVGRNDSQVLPFAIQDLT